MGLEPAAARYRDCTCAVRPAHADHVYRYRDRHHRLRYHVLFDHQIPQEQRCAGCQVLTLDESRGDLDGDSYPDPHRHGGSVDQSAAVDGSDWHYGYVEEDVSFFSKLATPQSQITGTETKGENYLLEVDNHLVLPVGQKVRILLTARDVIHAWWVPQLGGKKDAIPGFINEMWVRADETGTFRGQCAELCGKDHGFMPIVVDIVDEGQYQAWLDGQRNNG